MRRYYKPRSAAALDAKAELRLSPHDTDFRTDVELDLRGAGGSNLLLKPCRGKIAWRQIDVESGRVVARGSIKQLLHGVADALTRMQAPRNYDRRSNVPMPEMPDGGADETDQAQAWNR
jgi:hypothetical protein